MLYYEDLLHIWTLCAISKTYTKYTLSSRLLVADPGFPTGNTNLVGRGANARCDYVSKNL